MRPSPCALTSSWACSSATRPRSGRRRGLAGSASFARPWLVPLIVGAGALLGGLLVFGVAPEAEGHGTDAAISAVHHNPRGLRFRAVVVKIVASALTIGSGGSGGREGPTAQISAGFGSLLSRVLDLEPADSRVVVATGIGSGIGAIFGAPLGGAVLAAEILYRDDFDPTALLPCFIASAVSSLVFGAIEGFSPLFGYVGGYRFSDSSQLGWFALIGILGGLVGLLYAKGFYGMVGLFKRSPLPGGPVRRSVAFWSASSALVVPEVLGTGYGWVQKGLGPRAADDPVVDRAGPAVCQDPGHLAFHRLGRLGRHLRPRHGHRRLPGRGGLAGIRAAGAVDGPQSGALCDHRHDVLLRRYLAGAACHHADGGRDDRQSLDAGPAMIAVGIAWLIVRRSDDTIYRSQLKSRADAPAHDCWPACHCFPPFPPHARWPLRAWCSGHNRARRCPRRAREGSRQWRPGGR